MQSTGMNENLQVSGEYSLRQLVFRTFASAISQTSNLHTSSLEFVYDVQSDIPDKLLGHSSHVRDILKCLINNALKNLTLGGSVRHDDGRVTVSCKLLEMTNESVLLQYCVSDTGDAIRQDKLSLLFEYFQAEDPPDAHDPAVNSFLHRAATRARAIGGNIWAYSESNKGNRVFFTNHPQVIRSFNPTCLDSSSQFPNKTILFIDSLHDQTGVANQIRSFGLNTVVVHDVKSLTDPAGHPRPDVVVTDSVTAVERARAFDHLRWVPIIFLASQIPCQDLKWCIRNNILSHQYLTTPSSDESLFTALVAGLSTHIEPSGPSYNILLAEDNPIHRGVITKILETYGHKLQFAEDGLAAVKIHKKGCEERSQRFDIILMDIVMPVMDGFEATKQIREHEKRMGLPLVPVIGLMVVSACGISKAVEVGMSTYLPKALIKKDLMHTIDQLLSKENGGILSKRCVPFY
ncbi:hypothetical protein K435DRAFT_966669 [Dendrothele bispora CBS 962.96]|uniref:Response regulatory domain-containing protein n=1 Tax=Dendrothele bispora (strain CBS 962.96) TaxID=1314807 RepID=A0A4S8LZB0_DENBC|nr:hypothetical protein K435DRAFT_966669 [Dendrothele bispora CBS 962.96]